MDFTAIFSSQATLQPLLSRLHSVQIGPCTPWLSSPAGTSIQDLFQQDPHPPHTLTGRHRRQELAREHIPPGGIVGMSVERSTIHDQQQLIMAVDHVGVRRLIMWECAPDRSDDYLNKPRVIAS